MTQRHLTQSDATMLVTTVTDSRQKFFANPTYAREAIETLYRVQEARPFFLYAFCMMPDHAHLLLHVPSPETISQIMNVWKGGVTRNIGLKKLWQRRYDLRIVRKPEEARSYIHQNPVRAELVNDAKDYQWSSASGLWDVSFLDCTWTQ